MADDNTTWVIELVVVGMAAAVGLVYLTSHWPTPNAPLVFVGAATGAYVVLTLVSAVHERRRRHHDEAEGNASSQQSQAASGASSQPQPAAAPSPHALVGAASEDPTSLHDLDDLRPETADDITSPKISVPLFAENTMSLSQRELAKGARQVRANQGQQPATQQPATQQPATQQPADPSADDSDKTELRSVEELSRAVQSGRRPTGRRPGNDDEGAT